MHIRNPPCCHWMVQWHSNEWGLPSMTTVVFSLCPSAICSGAACERNNTAACGTVWHSSVRCFRWRSSCQRAQCVLAPPGTRCGGKLPSITHACMCRATGKFHNPRAHIHACHRKLKAWCSRRAYYSKSTHTYCVVLTASGTTVRPKFSPYQLSTDLHFNKDHVSV